jgi:CheY-like chemotaxis protein
MEHPDHRQRDPRLPDEFPLGVEDGIVIVVEPQNHSAPDLHTGVLYSPQLFEHGASCANVLGGKGILMVALTGWGQEEDRQKCRDVGFDSHLVKPVELPALMKLLAKLQSAPT